MFSSQLPVYFQLMPITDTLFLRFFFFYYFLSISVFRDSIFSWDFRRVFIRGTGRQYSIVSTNIFNVFSWHICSVSAFLCIALCCPPTPRYTLQHENQPRGSSVFKFFTVLSPYKCVSKTVRGETKRMSASFDVEKINQPAAQTEVFSLCQHINA